MKAVLAAAEAFGARAAGRPHAAGAPDLSVPRAKRRLGQHFLTDPRILARIADALGATARRHRARDRARAGRAHRGARGQRAGRLVAIEKDADLVPALRAAVPGADDRRGGRARGRLARARGPRWPRRRQHPLQHHLAADRQGARAAAARAHRVPGAEGGGGPGRRRAGRRGVRRAQRRGAGGGPRGAALHRARPARSIRGPRWTPRCSG